MKNQIKIVNGKRGFILKINNLFISSHLENNLIRAIDNKIGVPYGATEWASIQALRNYWHKYMPLILASTNKPYKSVWGQLVPSSDQSLISNN
jgi:hypothetical protein